MTLAHKIIGGIVSSRLGFAALQRVAFKTPHFHIFDNHTDELYMGRWWLIQESTGHYNGALEWVETRTIASRILEALTGYTAIRLHHINRQDHDRDLHSHPFDYRTFVCKGFYSEYYEDGVKFLPGSIAHCYTKRGYRTLFEGMTQTGAADKFHRISAVIPGGVWTMFCMTKRANAWGFMVNHEFIPNKAYFKLRGIGADGKAT